MAEEPLQEKEQPQVTSKKKLWRNTPENFWSYVLPPDGNGCRVWSGKCERSGYGRVSWLGHKRLAHRVAAMLSDMLTDITDRSVIIHHCDNRRCCNPDHLEVATQQKNMQDAVSKGRMKQPDNRGVKSGNSRLTAEQILVIRASYENGSVSQQSLADKFGVTQMVISRIVRGVSYCD